MDLPDTLAADLYDFAFCPEPCYERLVDLANPEPWGEGNRVLKNYLLFSFKRAVQLTRRDHAAAAAPSALPIVFDEGLCLFNTGLYTRRYETVYALFEPNTREDARQRWFLKGFFKESDPALLSFEYLPCRVRFAEDPSELVFDYRLPIRSNIDHILGDERNLTRIPASLKGEGNSLLLRRAFEGAVVEAARRAAANYTLAVPAVLQRADSAAPAAVSHGRRARARAHHPARGRLLLGAHLPHAGHGLQQRAPDLPPGVLLDQARLARVQLAPGSRQILSKKFLRCPDDSCNLSLAATPAASHQASGV